MSKRIQDIVGKRFGGLEVQSFSHKDKVSRNYFICICDCGKTKTVQQTNLLSGRSTSCGCSRKLDSGSVKMDTKPSISFVKTALGQLPVLTGIELEQIMTTEQVNDFKLKNPTYLLDPWRLQAGQQIVLKDDNECYTCDSYYREKRSLELTRIDGEKGILFGLDEAWAVYTTY